MSAPELTSDRIRRFLGQLTPNSKRNLLAEIERLQNYTDDGLPGAEIILTELRAEVRDTGESFDRPGNPARYFFQPLEPMLVNCSPERANCGQISRGSLSPIWEWMSQKLLPTMARDYMAQMKREIGTNNQRQADKIAAAFQFKVLKYIEGTLGSSSGADQVRAGLAIYTSSRAAFDDLNKLLSVLRTHAVLTKFQQALPPSIKKFEGKAFDTARVQLDTLTKASPEAMPFALTMLAARLQSPWQLLRLATKAAASKKAADVAATRYAVAVSMVLDQVEDRRLALRQSLKTRRILISTEILADIYDIEYAMRVRIDLEGSEWGLRLDQLMQGVAELVEAELRSVPDETQHVLASRRLRRHESLTGRLTYMAWKGRDALSGVASRYRGRGVTVTKPVAGG